jgi:ribosomal protein S18 acetylase RimI-like enzyme
MLGWPGCFCWGPTREGAIARGWSQVMGFVEWLRQHGEDEPLPLPGGDTVVEEVPAHVLSGGYEVNATFEADRRAVDARELDRTLRWLDYAHADLVEIAGRVRLAEAAGTRLPIEHRETEAIEDGAADGRDPDEVTRHVAGAETWLASRLDRSLRYEGVPPDGDPDAYLAATHAWAVERLRELWQRDPALAGTDGKGETWTLAKVLRRIVYHTLDHADELDRRLALAEDRLGRVELRVDAPVDAAALIELTTLAGLGNAARRGPAFMTRALANSRRTVGAYDGEQLIGFARIAGDGVLIGYVAGVVVHPHWQGRGLGTLVVERLLEGREEERFILEARRGAAPMYERLGFQLAPWAMLRRRQNPPSG